MSDQNLKFYHAWDLPTRWFHWINFVCVLGLAAIGTAILYDKELGVTDAGKVLLKTVHVWFGYVFAFNLLWRIVWAFVGNRYARWSAILPFQTGYISECRSYIDGLKRGDGVLYVGHNPLARFMVFLMLLLLVIQASTGLILAGTDIYYPPFGHWITAWIAAPGTDPASIIPYDKTGIDPAGWDAMRAFRSPIVTIHYWCFYALLAAIIVHIIGVVVTEVREGGNIISAMFTGKKALDRKPLDE